jgi:hypothetical protein
MPKCVAIWYAEHMRKKGPPRYSRMSGVARAVRRQPSALKQVGARSIMPTVATPVHEATSPRNAVKAWLVAQHACRFTFHAYSSRLVQTPCARAITARQRTLGVHQQYLLGTARSGQAALLETQKARGPAAMTLRRLARSQAA